MKIKRRKKAHAAVEAAALSDIMFFLLVFFLMLSTLASPDAIKVLLPQAKTGAAIPRQVVNLTVDKDSKIYIEKDEVDFDALKAQLESTTKNMENPTVVLKMDRTLEVQKLISIIDVTNQLKLPVVVASDKK
jgi:biopolymer transport protein ExbD